MRRCRRHFWPKFMWSSNDLSWVFPFIARDASHSKAVGQGRATAHKQMYSWDLCHHWQGKPPGDQKQASPTLFWELPFEHFFLYLSNFIFRSIYLILICISYFVEAFEIVNIWLILTYKNTFKKFNLIILLSNILNKLTIFWLKCGII